MIKHFLYFAYLCYLRWNGTFKVNQRANAKSMYWLYWLSMGCLSSLTIAQETSTHFERLSRKQGLSHSTVRAIVQDQQGFMWFGTQNGLNRYDGLEIRQYDHEEENPNSLQSSFIFSLAADPTGGLWIGSLNGLDYFDTTSQNFEHYSSRAEDERKIISGSVVELLVVGPGQVWVGSISGLSFVDRQAKITRRYPGLSFPQLTDGVPALAKAEQGGIWVGTQRGQLLHFNPETDRFTPLEAFERLNLGSHGITAILPSNDGLWVSTNGRGVVLLDLKTGAVEHLANNPFDSGSISDNSVNTILRTTEGTMWFATASNGLSKLFTLGSTLESYRHQAFNLSSLSSDQVFSLFQDRGGILWVGTNDGVSKLFPNSENVRHYRNVPFQENSLSHNRVKAFLEDSDDTLWIGTYGGGLNALDLTTGVFRHYQHDPQEPQSLPNDDVFSLFQNEAGYLWVGTFGSGLCLMDMEKGTFEQFNHVNAQMVSNRIVNISQGPEEKLWLATGAGVGLFDTEEKTFENVGNLPRGPGSDFVRIVTKGKGETWWMGTFASGLYRYDATGTTFRNYDHDPDDPESIINKNVLTILIDSLDRFWVGTAAGLERFDPSTGTFRHYQRTHGLPSNMVYGVLEDRAHRLWISTDNGLCRFDPEENMFIKFGLRNGIQDLEFNAGAYLKSHRSELIFGGINGFNIFHPSAMNANIHPPEVVLTSFKLLNKEVILDEHISVAEEIVLTHHDDVIAFEFAALDFAAPEKNTYAYKLEGFDEEWQHVGNRRFAGYTNLDPGTYTFKVRAANDDGVASMNTASVKLRIIPPFYNRPIFYLLCLVCVCLLLLAWHWNNQREQAKMGRLIAERTHSLEQSNRQLQETADNLGQTQRKLLESAHKVGMAEIASDVLHNVGNALNGIMVSANVVDKHIIGLKVAKLKRVSDLLRENEKDLVTFLSHEDKASKVIEILCRLSEDLEQARSQARAEIRELHERGLEIVSILRSQRKYALGEEYYEDVELPNLIEDVLHIQSSRIEELKIQVRKAFSGVPSIPLPKSKLLNVFNQIIKNSCEAMEMGSDRNHRILDLRLVMEDAEKAVLTIGDTGSGIPQDNLERIFTPGFSTKESSAGFGLHHCANALMEIGGAIRAISPGPGMGATFILEIPLKPERKSGGTIV